MTSAVGIVAVCMFLIGDLGIFPHARSQTLSNGPQENVSAGELAAAVEAQKQADAKLTRGESAERRFQELGAKLQQRGALRVIVQLRVAWRPEGVIQQAERLAQRASISQAQDDLLGGVQLRNPRSLKRFKNLPLLAFSVDATGLEALRSSSELIDIYADTPIALAQAPPPTVTLIGAPAAWQMGYNGAGKTIAILDSGVDKNHTSLSGKVVSEACYSTDDPGDENPGDEYISLCPGHVAESVEPGSGVNCTELGDCSHGTSVAGVAAAVAPGANLISIKVASFVNKADDCEAVGVATPCLLTSPSDLDKALDRVYELATTPGPLQNSVASVNVSWAFPSFSENCDNGNPVKAAIDNLRSIGIATVVAAGNGLGNVGQANAIGFPACTSSAISVGATGNDANPIADVMAPFSNGASFLSLLAPGIFASAPIPGGFSSVPVSGTSVAAAHVSGAWAIIKQWRPNDGVDAVFNRLNNSGAPITDPRNNNVPKSRIRIDAAFSCLQNVPGDRWKGEYFSNPDLEGNPVMRRDDGSAPFLNMNFGAGSPDSDCASNADNFSVRWTRTFNLVANVYQFSVTADDGARLYIDGVNKLDFWNGPAGTHTINVSLDERPHEIKLEFRELGGLASASLSWTNPCVADVQAGKWKGEYFNDNPANPNQHLAGSPLMVRDDGNNDFLNFDWGAGSPNSDCFIGADYFSARWTRSPNFSAGTWRFTVTGDDGVRLYVDGVTKIDAWRLQGPTTYTADMELNAGLHEIKLEYFEWTGTGVASLSWAQAPPLPPINLVTTPISTEQINLSWVDKSNYEEGYKIERWNGSGYSQIGTVGANVNTYADHGLSPSTTYYYQVRAYNGIGNSAYSNSAGTTTFNCTYALSPEGAGFPWYGGMGTITVSTPANCSWSASSDSSWIAPLFNASGVGNGSVEYRVQNYNVLDGSRDGRITIGGQIFWIGQEGPPSDCNQHCRNCCPSISSQGAALDQSATGAEPRGLTARYFDNTTLSGQPSLQRTDAIVNFDWAGGRPDAALPADRFSVRWSGQLTAPSSEAYKFHLYSDDGARLWVNNQLVIDRWQPPFEKQIRSAPVELKAGEKVDVRVEYYNAGGEALIQLLWSSASTPLQIIPQRHLYPEAATDKSAPADINKQTGMLLPPGPGADPKATRSQPGGRLALPLGRAGLALLMAGAVLALLLWIDRKELKRTDEHGNQFWWRARIKDV
jgi:subtilisin